MNYGYRLVMLRFDAVTGELTWPADPAPGAYSGLYPGERVAKIFDQAPEYQQQDNRWVVSVLLERPEKDCFSPYRNMDPDELTAILKGEYPE